MSDQLSVKEAAVALGVARETVRRMIALGDLSAYQKRPGVRGSAFRVPRAEVERVLRDRKRQLGCRS